MTATITPPSSPMSPPQVRDRPGRAPRELAALAALLVGTAVLYLWNLGATGWANDYYAAAVRSMTVDWKAFLFASFDAGGTVTVDKPPAALWVMALSGRVFGFSSWSMVVPQALMGVATVALLYAAVRRVSGPQAGLIAGAAFALTPVAAQMFRFNNPDALLVLLMVAAAYATVRAIERAGTRWLLLAGVLIGFGFLTKMGQALIVVPALALAYLLSAPTGLGRRVWQLLAAGGAIVVAAGWYVLVTVLWPAADRPYIGGSQGNSLMELALGYNGLGRIFGSSQGGAPSVGFTTNGAPPAGVEPADVTVIGFGGPAGLGRLFAAEIGDQVTWLLPAALVLFGAALWVPRRAPRTDPLRASLIIWGTWTVATFLVFSLAEGIFHPYYTVALAPGIAALAGIGGRELWQRRATWFARVTVAVTLAGTAWWAFVLLARSPEFLPWLRWVVVVIGGLAALALLLPHRVRALAAALVAAVTVTGLAGPTAYAIDRIVSPPDGIVTSAGPRAAGMPAGPPAAGSVAGVPDGSPQQSGQTGTGAANDGREPELITVGGSGPLLKADESAIALLRQAGTDWSAVTVGAQNAADLALRSNTDVMAIGGFAGSDPAPTLEAFQAHLSTGRIRYFVASSNPGNGAPGGARSTTGRSIAEWVQQHYRAQTIGGTTMYDLTSPK